MRMSTRGRYGLRMMIELACRYREGPVLVDTVAAEQGISRNYLHVLVSGLKSAGLVRGIRGRKGGYMLARAPSTITALDVITALEGRCVPVDCVLDAGLCDRSRRCASRALWSKVAATVDGALASVTLEHLADMQRAMNAGRLVGGGPGARSGRTPGKPARRTAAANPRSRSRASNKVVRRGLPVGRRECERPALVQGAASEGPTVGRGRRRRNGTW